MPLIENILKSNSINAFFECDVKQLQKDYHSIKEINVPNKAFLYHQGNPCSDVFWIKSGIGKRSYLTEQGTEITIALFEKGDVIGGLLNDSVAQNMEETAQALSDVDFYKVAYNDFKTMMTHRPELAWYIFEKIYAKKQKIERKLRTTLTQPIEKRVIATLLELAEIFGIRCTHGYALEIHLTQQEVADLVGASRSVVSTIFNDFRSRGILDYTREQICINDAAFTNL